MKKKALELCVEKKKRNFMAELQTTIFDELKKTQQYEAGDFFIGHFFVGFWHLPVGFGSE